MDKGELFVIIFLILITLSLNYAVIKTANNVKETRDRYYQEIEQKRREDDIRVRCAQYYNDGTGRWAECMGVGPK